MKHVFVVALIAIGLLAKAQTNVPASPKDIAPLLVGENIPDITLKSLENVDVNLLKLIGNKKTILVFYRGGWCPYCNAQLSALGEAEKEILTLGYQIVAVSPDAPKNLKVTGEESKLNYQLLSDSKSELSKAMGIAFKAPDNYEPYLSKGSEGVNTSLLPVPAVFIVTTKGVIQFEHINPDYKERISTPLLIAVAKALK